MQHSMSTHYYAEILPLIEMMFSQNSTEDEVLVLDKLEIDLGIIQQKDMEKDKWDDSILSTLKMKLEESLASLKINKKLIFFQ